MKRYLLFSGTTYYPCGGWADFQGDFDTIEEAEKAYRLENPEDEDLFTWMHIFDLEDRSFVRGAGKSHSGLLGKVKHNIEAEKK